MIKCRKKKYRTYKNVEKVRRCRKYTTYYLFEFYWYLTLPYDIIGNCSLCNAIIKRRRKAARVRRSIGFLL